MISFVVVATGQFVADFSDNYFWVFAKIRKLVKLVKIRPQLKKFLK